MKHTFLKRNTTAKRQIIANIPIFSKIQTFAKRQTFAIGQAFSHLSILDKFLDLICARLKPIMITCMNLW